MKFFILIALIAAFAVFVSADNSQRCSQKNPNVVNAIGRFCQKGDMVINSLYAWQGSISNYRNDWKAHVWIRGTCNPPQWVPQKYCFSQMYDICANGGPHGGGRGWYGTNRCQEWSIFME
nr:hypothetical protein B0A51_00136 [Rachicladosporium sp. CCFEE 5018]